MCIIIDTNMINDFFNRPQEGAAKPLYNWLNRDRGWGMMLYTKCGDYGEELESNTKAKAKLEEFSRRGRARIIDNSAALKAEEEKLERLGCKSNDIPILALARVGGARLLYTADQNLMADFKNEDIIDNPKGKIYSRANHKHLLKKDMCSPQVKPTK